MIYEPRGRSFLDRTYQIGRWVAILEPAQRSYERVRATLVSLEDDL
jgi:hypothetical protein